MYSKLVVREASGARTSKAHSTSFFFPQISFLFFFPLSSCSLHVLQYTLRGSVFFFLMIFGFFFPFLLSLSLSLSVLHCAVSYSCSCSDSTFFSLFNHPPSLELVCGLLAWLFSMRCNFVAVSFVLFYFFVSCIFTQNCHSPSANPSVTCLRFKV